MQDVGVHLWLFMGIAAVVIVVPGPDTALVTRTRCSTAGEPHSARPSV
jgi:hypothetical protein